MDLQDDDIYNEANAAVVNLEDITSSARNATILRQFRDGDDKLTCLHLGMHPMYFTINEGDDLGWLGYLIGKSQYLYSLTIWDIPEGGEQQINAFVKGIARNHSIRDIYIENMSDDARAAIVRAIGNYSQLESLWITCRNNFGPNSHSAVGTLLESGVCQLRELWLYGNGINDDAVATSANGFKGIAESLEVLELSNTSIGNEGLLAVVAGLANSTSLKKLDLAKNDFSSAAEGLHSLSALLQSLPKTLQHLNLRCCRINDEGLQAFIHGSAIHCRELIIEGNESVTATGLCCLSNSLQSDSYCIEALNLYDIPSAIGDDGMKALARVLAHNKSLRSLRLGTFFDESAIPPAQWLAFSTALCDPSSVNSTYLSNHTIHNIICVEDGTDNVCPEDIDLYLRLNEQHPNYAARCKILMKHQHLHMQPFLQWKWGFLPLAVTWFEQAKTCTTLNVQLPLEERRVVEESDGEFESRVLSAMYEFVRGMPIQVMESRNGLELAAAYDEKIKTIEEENTMHSAQLDSENVHLKAKIAHLEHKKQRIVDKSTKLLAQHKRANELLRSKIDRLEEGIKRIEEEKKADLEQRDGKIMQLRSKTDRLEEENKRIEEEKKADMEQRDGMIMQHEKEISRLEHENKIIYFCRLLTVFALCFPVIVDFVCKIVESSG